MIGVALTLTGGTLALYTLGLGGRGTQAAIGRSRALCSERDPTCHASGHLLRGRGTASASTSTSPSLDCSDCPDVGRAT